MALSVTAARALSDKLPKVINAKQHAVIDYVMLGTFVSLGAMFLGRNKRAAVGAFICGGAAAINTLLTDYPGGVAKVLSFETHGKIDAGLSGIAGTTPSLFGFDDEPEAKYFRLLGIAEAAVTGMTDFESIGGKVVEMPRERRA